MNGVLEPHDVPCMDFDKTRVESTFLDSHETTGLLGGQQPDQLEGIGTCGITPYPLRCKGWLAASISLIEWSGWRF